MVPVAQYATPRQMYDRYAEIHRKFFPPPPPAPPMVEPPPPPDAMAVESPPPVAPEPTPPLTRVIAFQKTMARMRAIRRVVCDGFDITKDEITQKRRCLTIVIPRQIFSYLVAKHTKASLTQIAKALDQDHTTVMHSIDAVKRRMFASNTFKNLIDELEEKLCRQFGDDPMPADHKIKYGRYVPHNRVADYLSIGWTWSDYINSYGVLMVWCCGCPCVEPKE